MLFVRIKQIGLQPTMPRAKFNQALRAAWEAPAVLWHREMRPLHFTRQGARQYGYLPRSGENYPRGQKGFYRTYSGRKLRRFGHMDPLVFTGTSRSLTRARDIRTTSKGGRVVMNAPALNFKPHGRTVSMRDELTRITPAERQRLVGGFRDALVRELGSRGHTVTTNIGAAVG